MSKMSTKERPVGWEDQHGSAGRDSYNPSESDYQRKFDDKFNDMVNNEKQLADLEKNLDAPYQGKNGSKINTLGESEREPDVAPRVTGSGHMNREERNSNRRLNRETLRRAFTGKNLRKKSSMITLAMLLFGGAGFLTVFFSPSLAIIQMKEVFTKSLNDQLHAVDERSSVLIRSKLKETTKGSCGAIKIKCRFATMTTKEVEKYKAAGIDVERDMTKGFGGNRGQITKMTYMDEDGVTTIRNASELQKALIDHEGFRAASVKAHNPLYSSLSDKLALGVMSSLGISKRLVATGNSDEERQKGVNKAVDGPDESRAKSIITSKDKDGNTVYTDSDGNPLTEDQVKEIQKQATRVDGYAKTGGMSSVFKGALKGINVVGTGDSACTVFNSARYVSALSKVMKQTQAIRFAMAMVLTPADSIKAGDAKPDDVTFIGNKLTETRPQSEVIDESKINDPNSATNPATTEDPDAGKNALNAPGYEIAAYDTVPDINMRASRFMLAGGSVAILDGVLSGIAKIVSGGNPNPKVISQKCGYIQNPAVRFSGLAIGVIVGIGSFGLATVASIAGSMAIAMALPYIESQAADILTGNLFENLSNVDVGDAAYVGSAGLFGTLAMNRGMKPLDKESGMEYLAKNKQDYAEYTETQKYLARSTPFDLTNQFSFMGSIAQTIVPVLQRSKTNVSSAMMNVASLIPTSFGMFTKTAHAVPADYFDHCNDQTYKSLGLAAGPFCEVRYGMSDEELAMDPLQNVQWMADTGNIDAASETGDAKDNKQPWNYVKFLDECVHRTVGWGEDQDENTGDGSNCMDPAKEEMNKHFRVYTMDRTVDQSMDGDDSGGSPEVGLNDGQAGTANSDGWAFPTVSSDVIIKNYRPADDPGFTGVNIAASSEAETKGQPIFAAYDGRVVVAGPDPNYGNWIIIKHRVNGKDMTTVYAHMDDGGITVQRGQDVKAGDEIGFIGSNKTEGDKPYLYFELWDGQLFGSGQRIDPLPYIEAARGNK